MPTFEELIALAETRAATEVEAWVPTKVGDKIAGIVEEVGTITTKFGEYATTTIKTMSDYVEDGAFKPTNDNNLVRVAWMGAVLVAQFQRMWPTPGDIVAFHYQSDETPSNGMNDYANIVAVVIDPETGRSKMPVNMNVAVPTRDQIVNADAKTGEVASAAKTFEPFTEDNEKLADKKTVTKKNPALENQS